MGPPSPSGCRAPRRRWTAPCPAWPPGRVERLDGPPGEPSGTSREPSSTPLQGPAMPRAAVTDLYRIDDLLSAEEKAARDLVAGFIDREYLPVVGKHFRNGTFPM